MNGATMSRPRPPGAHERGDEDESQVARGPAPSAAGWPTLPPERAAARYAGDPRARATDEQADHERRHAERPRSSRCQPIVRAARAGRPDRESGTRIVPTFPPAMCALIANPRRSGGNASDRNALPTGCCGLAPMRETLIPASSCPIDAAARPKSRLAPKSSWPPARSSGRGDVAGHEAVGDLHRAADRGGDGDERADVAPRSARTRAPRSGTRAA